MIPVLEGVSRSLGTGTIGGPPTEGVVQMPLCGHFLPGSKAQVAGIALPTLSPHPSQVVQLETGPNSSSKGHLYSAHPTLQCLVGGCLP